MSTFLSKFYSWKLLLVEKTPNVSPAAAAATARARTAAPAELNSPVARCKSSAEPSRSSCTAGSTGVGHMGGTTAVNCQWL